MGWYDEELHGTKNAKRALGVPEFEGKSAGNLGAI